MSLAIPGAKTSAPADRFFPSRHPVLNLCMGGGFVFGAFHEIYGPSDSYKTTSVLEHIATAQSLGMAVIVIDREGRIKADRLALVGGDPDYPLYFYFDDDTWTLTIEKTYELIGKQVHRIRCHDVTRVAEKIRSKKGAKGLTLRYREVLGLKSDAKPAQIANGLHERKTGKPDVHHWHRLLEEDRTDILVVIDSTTSMPANSRVQGDKKPSAVEDRREQDIRGNAVMSRTMGQEARAWSEAFRAVTWMDTSLITFMVTQQRLRGFNRPGRMPYQAPARPGANAYYARTHIAVGVLWDDFSPDVIAHPAGGWYFAREPVAGDDIRRVVGNRLLLSLKKASAASYVDVPAFYLKGSGVEPANSVWECLVRWGLVSKIRGRDHTVDMPSQEAIEESTPDVCEIPLKFTRVDFTTELYEKHGEAWTALLRHALGTVL